MQRTIKFPGGVTFIHLKTENSSYDDRMHAIVTRTYESRGGGGGGYCHIWAIWVCAAVKGMVFKQFTLG